MFSIIFIDDLSLSSDSLEDDSIDETKTPSPEHIVPESTLTIENRQQQQQHMRQHPQPLPATPFDGLIKVKEEPIVDQLGIKSEDHLDDGLVENAAKELFGNDLLFNQDDLQTDEFWNELIDTSENHSLSETNKVLLSEDLEELESSIKVERESPSSAFFSSAMHPPTLASF